MRPTFFQLCRLLRPPTNRCVDYPGSLQTAAIDKGVHSGILNNQISCIHNGTVLLCKTPIHWDDVMELACLDCHVCIEWCHLLYWHYHVMFYALWYMHEELREGIFTVRDVGSVVNNYVMGSQYKDTQLYDRLYLAVTNHRKTAV